MEFCQSEKVGTLALHCMGKTNSINMQCTGVSRTTTELSVYCYMCMLRVEGC